MGDLYHEILSDEKRKGKHKRDPVLVGQSLDFADTDGRVVDLVIAPGITDSEFQVV